MISHLGMRLALQRADGDRAAARALIREGIIAQAEQEATHAERSLNCGAERHAGQPYGCANDGTGCLCECHDAPDQIATKEPTARNYIEIMDEVDREYAFNGDEADEVWMDRP